jgi:transcriptional regulator with XRE-family HTH domain
MSGRPRPCSRYTLEALQLLGEQIRLGRRARHWTQAGLAERVGISRATLAKAENGDPGVAIGTVFELAALAGTTLFHPDQERLSLDLNRTRARSALLPKRIVDRDPDDDF